MARTSSINPGLLRRQTESTPNTNTEADAEKKEETQSEPKASEKENNANGSSSEEEETTQRKNRAITEGKKPMDAKEGKQKWDFIEMTRGQENTKGVVIEESKKSETDTIPVKSGKRKVRYAVRSPCTLKSPLKKLGVDIASDDEEPKGKGKEKDADDFEDPGADSEETCKRIKKERNSDNDGGGDGAGAHTNLSNLGLGEGLVAGN